MNQIVPITTLNALMDRWGFFREGLSVLNDPKGGRGNVPEDQFFKTLLHVCLGREEVGQVLLFVTQRDDPLAFIVTLDNTIPFGPKSAVVYAVYTNNKCATAVKPLFAEMKKWCRYYGYQKLYAVSYRVNGSAVRLFRKWGFRQDSIVFQSKL